MGNRGDMTLSARRILLVIGGGIAAYKALDLIRRLRERGAAVRPVMTEAAQHFVTPLSVGALAADHVFTDLFDRQDEQDVGHIRLAREADVILVAPATADLMGKLANGLADDLASAILLASDRPVLMAPAMNPKMWAHPATRRNRATLEKDGVRFVGPGKGEMAESGEAAPHLARLSSTTFDAQLDVASRVASESPALYFEIQSLNAYGDDSLRALEAAIARLRRIVSGRDEAQFDGLMTRGKSYLDGRSAMRVQT